MMQREPYKFFPMLGPAEEHPVGSLAWAERIGHRLQIHIERVQRNEEREVPYLIPVLDSILDATPRPWVIWPEQKPARTPEAWFELVTGQSVDSVAKLIAAHDPESPLIRKLQAVEAVDNPQAEKGDNQFTLSPASAHSRSSPGHDSSTSIRRILARLARDNPEILAAYRRGEFPSARAAGIAARIIKPPNPAAELRKWWRKASPAERAAFLAEIGKIE